MDINRFSATTYPYRDEPLETALKTFAALGFKRVDLLGRAPHFDPDPATLNISALKRKVENYGLSIANIASYCGDFTVGSESEKEAELARLKRTIDAAVYLGSNTIRVFRGGVTDNVKYVPAIVPWFRQAAAYAAEKNIGMGLENHGGGISNDPIVFRDLCDQVGSKHFGMLYDPCNCHTSGGDYNKMFDLMKDYLIHVHIKDGTTTAGSHQTTMLGAGELDIRWVLDQIDASGYQGDITLEYENINIPPAVGLKIWMEYLAGI